MDLDLIQDNQKEKDIQVLAAVQTNNIDLLKLLLKNGASPNASDQYGFTALMWAIRSEDNIAMVNLLIEKGANNLEAIDKFQGRTALMWAVCCEQIDIVNILLKCGANPQAQNYDKETVLFEVRNFSNDPEMTFLLLSCVFDENAYKNIHFELFNATVIKHRMSAFNKLGLLYVDKNEKNPFPRLPMELMGRILELNLSLGNDRLWHAYHAKQDAMALCNAFKTLTFSSRGAEEINTDETRANNPQPFRLRF